MTPKGTTKNWQKAAGALAVLALAVSACGGDGVAGDDDAIEGTAEGTTSADASCLLLPRASRPTAATDKESGLMRVTTILNAEQCRIIELRYCVS